MMLPRWMVVSLLVLAVAACTDESQRIPPSTLVRDTTPARARDSIDASLRHVTDRYEEMITEQMAAADPVPLQNVVVCEVVRLTRIYGERQAGRLIEAADHRAVAAAGPEASRRLDSLLGGHEYVYDPHRCDSLARAGQLGDSIWPEDKVAPK